MKLRVMTYNIWSGRNYEELLRGKRQEDIKPDVRLAADVIRNSGADIVALNEINGKSVKYGEQTDEIAEYAGYKYRLFVPALCEPTGEYGNAILSKYPITKTKISYIGRAAGEKLGEQRVAFCSCIDCGKSKVSVIVSHFGLVTREKAAAVSAVRSFVAESGDETVLMGDFNSEPNSDTIKEIKTFLNDATASKPQVITWPSKEMPLGMTGFSGEKNTKKLDYIFVSSGIKVYNSDTLSTCVSDHRPIFADIEL